MSEGQKVERKALDSKVIAVASEGYNNDWTAYIGAVEGKNHEDEWEGVLHNGTKLPQAIAEILFPEFATKYKWRA